MNLIELKQAFQLIEPVTMALTPFHAKLMNAYTARIKENFQPILVNNAKTNQEIANILIALLDEN